MKQPSDSQIERIAKRRAREGYNLFARLPAIYSASRAQAQKLLQRGGGLSVVEWRTLWDLHEVGPTSVRNLAGIQRTDHSLLSRALPEMKRKGLVITTRSAQDARQTIVEITDAGLAAYERAAPIMRMRREAVRANFTPEELEVFIEYLDRMEVFFNAPIENFLSEDTSE